MNTGQECCKLISKHRWIEYGVWVKPKIIWEYSPTGELFMIGVWYQQALDYFS